MGKFYRGKKHYENDYIIDLAKKSRSKREMLIDMQLPLVGTYGYRVLNYFIEVNKVDISHFEGQNRNRNDLTRNATPLLEILEGKHPQYSCNKLKHRMLKAGILTPICSGCDLSEWRGLPIPLDLDHINGKSWDHMRDNLRLLCRNCHAQTDTFCGKNKYKNVNNKSDNAQNILARNQQKVSQQTSIIPLVLNSGIDFKKKGWVSLVAPIINQKPQKVNVWMKKYMPEFYKTCFIRKPSNPIIT